MAAILTTFIITTQAKKPADNNQTLLLLSNKKLSIAVSPAFGGELSSLKVNHDSQWHEVIYRANDYSNRKGWRGKAPVLWPATGATSFGNNPKTGEKPGHYLIGEQHYSMPFHGFIRDQAWQVKDYTDKNITLTTSNNSNTEKLYPFGFTIDVNYIVHESSVDMLYKIKASEKNQHKMPFSIGNHITFKAPFLDNSSDDAFIFSNACQQRVERNKKGLPTGKLIKSDLKGDVFFNELPERKSISLTRCGKNKTITLTDPSGLSLALSHYASSWPAQPVIEYNLWASKKSGFISPEPWVGTQNSLNSGFGLIQLLPGQTWEWKITIAIKH